MNLFGSIANIGKAVVNTAMTPVDAAIDSVTGGLDDNEPRTVKRVKQIGKNIGDAYDDVTDDE